MLSLAQYLAMKREEKGWTQKKLAEEAGISPSIVNRIESNATPNPGSATVTKLASALDISAEDLLSRRNQTAGESTAEKVRIGCVFGPWSAALLLASKNPAVYTPDLSFHSKKASPDSDEYTVSTEALPGKEKLCASDSPYRLHTVRSLLGYFEARHLDAIVVASEVAKEVTFGIPAACLSHTAGGYDVIYISKDSVTHDTTGDKIRDTKFSKVLYPEGTVGTRLAQDVLDHIGRAYDHGVPKEMGDFSKFQKAALSLGEASDSDRKGVLVISWAPMTNWLKDAAKGELGNPIDSVGYALRRNEIQQINKLLALSKKDVKLVKMDLIINPNSTRIRNWISSGGFSQFFRKLDHVTKQLQIASSALESTIVELSECWEMSRESTLAVVKSIDYVFNRYEDFSQWLEEDISRLTRR